MLLGRCNFALWDNKQMPSFIHLISNKPLSANRSHGITRANKAEGGEALVFSLKH